MHNLFAFLKQLQDPVHWRCKWNEPEVKPVKKKTKLQDPVHWRCKWNLLTFIFFPGPDARYKILSIGDVNGTNSDKKCHSFPDTFVTRSCPLEM